MKEALDIGKGYKEKYGFHDEEKSVFKSKKGLNHQVVDDISDHKNEPDWMRAFRHKSLDIFLSKPMPTWGGKLDDIDFDEIFYYLKPSDHKGQTWEDVPAEIKRTFDKLGIPESEQKFLAGAGAQYESESVYHNLKKEWEDKGVIFLDTDSALRDHPEIFRKFFATIVPPDDNKFSALNSAVWSGGSFLYVPPGVHVDLPLQAYFRINAKNVGQFERTLLIVDKGAQAHYVEGCFTKGTKITTNPDYKNIEEIKVGEKVLTHTGQYKKVYHVQERPYTGDLYTMEFYGDATQKLEVTEAHPFVAVERERINERNRSWKRKWLPACELSQRDYVAIPIDKRIESSHQHLVTVPMGNGSHGYKNLVVPVPSSRSFFRLAGYFLAEGSVSGGHYLNFSFHENERDYIEDVKSLLREVFQVEKINETHHKANRGTNVVVCSTALARVFVALFGKNAFEKKVPEWMRWEEPVKQRELITALFRGDGNYYFGQNKHGRKELFRISTISETLAHQVRDMLLRLGTVSAINCQKNRGGNRKPMFNVCIGGEQAEFFGALVGTTVQHKLNGKKRATMFHIDEHFAYLPIKKITKRKVKNLPVYNFGVEGDESYVAGGLAVHNCTAPSYSTDSLHSAVVEVIVMEGARFRYTTIQNWSANVYNLVTKRSQAFKDATMEWVDANLGSKLTMKYPSIYLMEPGAKGDILSVAFAGAAQHQDAGGKIIHCAPNTSSHVLSKSVSQHGGRSSYRGLVKVYPGCKEVKSTVRCDALLMDKDSRSDTYPYMEIDEKAVSIGHEATVSKIGDEQLFYLRSRGLSEEEANSMIVSGFIEPIVKELPMEYAIEMNRLIQLQMEGSVG
ncbi:MAG: Fe-S cluster assembly protein SufB [Deltaproteobacteria bacterium]|nr:Fe-S cluster assembly protein SufB [Deltaproteobacteria bacterium]